MTASIVVKNASVRYPVAMSGSQQSVLASSARALTGGRVGKSSSITEVESLKNVNLELKPGDRLGLIGRNGAGKSTMLKLLSGLLPPAVGSISIEGSRMNILSLGSGTDPEETGLENIDTMCRLLEIPRNEWKRVREDVIDFTELGEFIAMPVRTYSAGMGMRLMFALATAYPRDILILDEVIGAGDAMFIDKATARMERFIQNSSILVLATHSKDLISSFCNRCIYLQRGNTVVDGDPEVVWSVYSQAEGGVNAIYGDS